MRSWASPQRLPFWQGTEQSQTDGIGFWPHGVQNLSISVDYSIFFFTQIPKYALMSCAPQGRGFNTIFYPFPLAVSILQVQTLRGERISKNSNGTANQIGLQLEPS